MSDNPLIIARAEWRRARQASGTLEPGTPEWAIERAAARYIAELNALASRLQAELDSIGTRDVFLCMERDLDMAKAACLEEGDGKIIRTTDTHREWIKRDGAWEVYG